MREWIKALPLTVGLPLVIGAASVKPEDAASNIAAWVEWLGFHNLPHWLTNPNADQHVIAAACCAAVIYSFAVWGPLRRERHSGTVAHNWGPWVLILGGPILGLIWLYLAPHPEPKMAEPAPKSETVAAKSPFNLAEYFAKDFNLLS